MKLDLPLSLLTAEQKASEIIDKYGITAPEHIRLEDIAFALGARIVEGPLSGAAAMPPASRRIPVQTRRQGSLPRNTSAVLFATSATGSAHLGRSRRSALPAAHTEGGTGRKREVGRATNAGLIGCASPVLLLLTGRAGDRAGRPGLHGGRRVRRLIGAPARGQSGAADSLRLPMTLGSFRYRRVRPARGGPASEGIVVC